jgi:hypothetical protein
VESRRAQAEGDALVPYREMGLASARHLEALMHGGDARSLSRRERVRLISAR